MDKTTNEMTFNELVDYLAGEILKGLIAGRFHVEIFSALHTAIRWGEYQAKG